MQWIYGGFLSHRGTQNPSIYRWDWKQLETIQRAWGYPHDELETISSTNPSGCFFQESIYHTLNMEPQDPQLSELSKMEVPSSDTLDIEIDI